MSAPDVRGSAGRVVLGTLLGKGGEGSVYEVSGRPELAAKIYLAPANEERSAKLAVMPSLRTSVISQLTAWPIDVLRQPDGKVRGFLMENLRGSKDIHRLYSPKSRLADFPNADWRMVVRAALNTARAFAALHQAGHLVGDVNHGGVRVASDATVRLIDTDSFQVSHQGRVFRCEVGVQDFTPPELHGKAFASITRTVNHDNFGLAVLIFQMLLNGRHPFAGRYSGPGDMPIERAIPEFRYAYTANGAALRMQPPPFSAPASAASAPVAQLWERAFGQAGTAPGARPSAQEWIKALEVVERKFARCSAHPAHYYYGALSACPWCPIERAGIALFGMPLGSAPPVQSGPTNADAIWRDILSIALPAWPAPPQVPAVLASPAIAALGQRKGVWQTVAWAVALSVILLGVLVSVDLILLWGLLGAGLGVWINSRGRSDIAPIESRFRQAKDHFEGLCVRWREDRADAQFRAKRQGLDALKTELGQLQQKRDARYSRLVQDRQTHALRVYLDQFEIERASIPGIGAAKKAMLESFGIETAADVDKRAVMNVPGFGPALTERLLKWRRGLEGKFRFNASGGVDPRLVADLDRSIAVRRAEILKELQAGRADLQQMRQVATAQRQALEGAMRDAVGRYAQARADARAIGIRGA
ncbi:hypothetical protein [Luteimonas sp. FCS-9]|uniref:helix-hairpin-helix domain-containing protein n=1 Tax=Luteimonas sp. FCS-9 TaxID=1547516 RepID=UPI00063EBF4A|nr:hypothetical protein [Luteimonas sp. FCS-9]KLJ01303.1 hypothetical protein WQ56_05855 [Luteimonas sp. FCS-9]